MRASPKTPKLIEMFGLFGTSTLARKPRPKAGHKALAEIIEVSGRSVRIVRRPYKRSLGLTLRLNGEIRVSAPVGVAVSKIREFVVSQDQWIQENLAKYESLRNSYPEKTFCEGEEFPFLGKTLRLKFEPVAGRTRPCVKVRGDLLICEIRQEVWHLFNPSACHPELKKTVISFYQKQARTLLVDRVREYATRMQLMPTGLKFRSQKTRWGSCSSKGTISLNWKLMIAPREVIDYVVVHELAHLQHYDHSSAFWDLVGTHVGDYRDRRNWLREHQFDADFLNSKSELR